jgi:hypothetical protein
MSPPEQIAPKELEKIIRELLDRRGMSDQDLRNALDSLGSSQKAFAGFTWLWGPILYRRNRVLFRPFILSRFSTYMILPKWKVKTIHWKGDTGKILDAWFAEVDRNDDADLFRKLYEWKLSELFTWKNWEKRAAHLRQDLLSRYRAASSSAQRQVLLRKFDLWFALDEDTALALYMQDSKSAAPYILRHLPSGWLTAEALKKIWTKLIAAAESKGDSDFRWKLYRIQVPVKQWEEDGLRLCRTITDREKLIDELVKHHPEGWARNLADGFYKLAEARGRDIFPYIGPRLRSMRRGIILRGSYGKLLELAREKQWWDLWAGLLRTCASAKEFNSAITKLVQDKSMPEPDLIARLNSLAGVSREWNWGGFSMAQVHQLTDDTAIALYNRFSALAKGAFKLHLQSSIWGEVYTKFLELMLQVKDEEMIDALASRTVTRYGRWGKTDKVLESAEKLADYYSALKNNEVEFSRRAANVLGQVPAFSIWNYNMLIRENRLARLLFERSAASYLADPRSIADLVEGAEIHVMALAYRALALDDERARTLAAQNLPLLLGTLLRPLQRETRGLAFGALSNAATTLDTARIILSRARDALNLPDKKYPKEKLIGLIGRLLHKWPELRSAEEQPVIYERAA